MAKLLLTTTVPTLLCHVKSEKRELTVTFCQCPSCVYFVSVKGLFVQRSAEVCMRERGNSDQQRSFSENAKKARQREGVSFLKIYRLYCSVNCV